MILAVESVLQIFTTPSTPLQAILEPSPEKRALATAAVWLHRVSCTNVSNLTGASPTSVVVVVPVGTGGVGKDRGLRVRVPWGVDGVWADVGVGEAVGVLTLEGGAECGVGTEIGVGLGIGALTFRGRVGVSGEESAGNRTGSEDSLTGVPCLGGTVGLGAEVPKRELIELNLLIRAAVVLADVEGEEAVELGVE